MRYRIACKYRLSSMAKYQGRERMSETHEGFHSFKKAQAAYRADLSRFQDPGDVAYFVLCQNQHASKKWKEPIHAAGHDGREA